LFLNPDRSRVLENINHISVIVWEFIMRDVTEILRAKEQELIKVKRQVEALRIAAPLLSGEDPVVAAITPKNPRENAN
jgi:hypothetical protein